VRAKKYPVALAQHLAQWPTARRSAFFPYGSAM
jgi:hypothetical protein